MPQSLFGVLQSKLRSSPNHATAETLSATLAESDLCDVTTTFSAQGEALAAEYLGLGPSSNRASKGNGFPEPRLEELYLMLRLLSQAQSPPKESRHVLSAVRQKLEHCGSLEHLLDLANQGIAWYFQSAHCQNASRSVMSGSSCLGSITHTQQPSTVSVAALNVPHAVGASPSDISLLRLTLVCDCLFMYLLPTHVDDPNNSVSQGRRQSSRLRSTSRSSIAPDVPPRTPKEWERVAARISSLIMLTSDAREEELAIRRCALSLTGALLHALPHCAPATAGSASCFVPEVILQQVHHHCPTHFALMSVARPVLASASAYEHDQRLANSRGSTNTQGQLDSELGMEGTQHRDTVEVAHQLLTILSSSCAARSVLADTLYARTYGDPFGVYDLLRSTALAPAVCSFVDAMSRDFWRRCDSGALQGYCWALAELLPFLRSADDGRDGSDDPDRALLGVAGRTSMLTYLTVDVFSAHEDAIEDASPTSRTPHTTRPASPDDHWRYLGSWLALQAVLVAETAVTGRGAIDAAFAIGALQSGDLDGNHVFERLRRTTLRCLSLEREASSAHLEEERSSWFEGPDLSNFGGPSSVEHDTALSVLLLLDALLLAVGEQETTSGRQALNDKIAEASRQVLHLRSLFHEIAQAALSAQTFHHNAATLLSGSPMAMSLRCVGRHYGLLFDGATLPLLEYLLCDDTLRRLSASPCVAESAVHPMLLSAALVSRTPPFVFSNVMLPLVRSLSQCGIHQQTNKLSLASRFLLSNTWQRIVSHIGLGCPHEWASVLSGAYEAQVVGITLLHEVANVLVLCLYAEQEGVFTMGMDTVRSVLLDSIRLLTTISCAGNADAVIRHEVLWNQRPISLFYLLVSVTFRSRDSEVVEATASLVVDALEHYQECDSLRKQSAGVFATGTANDDTTRPLFSIRRVSTTSGPQRHQLSLQILEALANDNSSIISVPRLLVLKAMLVYDASLFEYLFPPPSDVQRRQHEQTNVTDSGASPKNSNAHPVLLRLLQDTIEEAASPPRDRAEALELMRRIGRNPTTEPLSITRVVEGSRPCDASVSPPPASTEASNAPECAAMSFSPAVVDNALVVACTVRYVAQEMARRVVSFEGKGLADREPPASTQRHGNRPLSPMKSSMRDAAAATRCPDVVRHTLEIEELLRRALRFVDTIADTADTCLQECSQELHALHDALYLGMDFEVRRVRMRYGDAFAVASHTPNARSVCVAMNRVASCLDVLTELAEAIETLLLAIHRDLSNGSKMLDLVSAALAGVLRLLPLCVPVHSSLAWYAGRLLSATLCATGSFAGCIRGELDRSASLRSASVTGALTVPGASLLSDRFRDAYHTTLQEPSLLERDDAVGTLLLIGSALSDTLRYNIGSGPVTVKSLSIPTPVELMTRALQIRCRATATVLPSSSEHETPASTLTISFLDCAIAGCAAHGSSTSNLQALTLVRCLWQSLHSRIHDAFELFEATVHSTRALLICRLLDALATLITHGPEGTALHLPLDEVLQVVSLLGSRLYQRSGGVPSSCGYVKDPISSGAVELTWYSAWRGVLAVLRAVILRLPRDASDWLDAIVACLTTTPRFQTALSGPMRPQAPAGLPSAASAADFEATILLGELRETELAYQVLSCATTAPSSSRRHSSRMFEGLSSCIDAICVGFAVLRKPNMLLSMVRRPINGSADVRDAEALCTSTVKDLLWTLVWWSSESENWLGVDYQPKQHFQRVPVDGAQTVGPMSSGQSDWPAVTKSVFSLEALRDYLVSQFTSIKKLHRDAAFTTTPSVSSAHPPSTPHLFSSSLSPSMRSVHACDGAESVADSEASSPYADHPHVLQSHVQSIKAAVHLFARAVQVRSNAASQSGATWTGPGRDTAEKLEWNLKSISSDLRNYDNMGDVSIFLENARLFIDRLLHRAAAGATDPTPKKN